MNQLQAGTLKIIKDHIDYAMCNATDRGLLEDAVGIVEALEAEVKELRKAICLYVVDESPIEWSDYGETISDDKAVKWFIEHSNRFQY